VSAPPTREPRVELRRVVEDDLAVFYEHQADPVANALAMVPAREREAFLAHWTSILADPSTLIRTVLVDGRPAGNVMSFERFGHREVGYWIGREHWGRGVATSALASFVAIDRARPLTARVAVQNVGSIRVLEKCGFVVVDDADAESHPPIDDVEEVVLRLDGPG
jgi:RimJ/RimL family protein N-acetyltransferase